MTKLFYTSVTGDCMGPDWNGVDAVIDPAAPIYSGDAVRVLVRDQRSGELHGLIKYLECTRDGRWWLVCLDGVAPLCGYFVPAAIEKVVDRLPESKGAGDVSWPGAGRVVIEQWDRLSLDARVEWTAQGKPRGILFPGIEAALAKGSPPTHWPESFRLPPNYYGEAA